MTTTTEFKKLAGTALHERAARAMVVGATKSGRTIIELHGERGEAELKLDTLCAVLAMTRKCLA